MREEIHLSTTRHTEMKEITSEVQEIISRHSVKEGICVVYCPHTTAGLTINENADPDVCADLEKAFEKVVPDLPFAHMEGDSPLPLSGLHDGSIAELAGARFPSPVGPLAGCLLL